jgi:TatD DNase family protein
VIDLHCHLDLYPEPSEVANECTRRGLCVLSVTTTPSAWAGTSALATNSQRIRTALGLHPQLAHERKNEVALFDLLLPKADYVGEIGLDGSPEYRSHWSVQVEVFEHILERCAAEGGRIASIHSRRASRAVLERIEKFQDAGAFVLHWFSGSFADVDVAARLGCWFSVGPAMLAGDRGKALVARMPRDRVLTESDGPFAQLDGVAVMPWDVDQAVTQLAAIWEQPVDEAHETIRTNLRSLLAHSTTSGSTPSRQCAEHVESWTIASPWNRACQAKPQE